MASSISHLPHIKNTQAGNNYYDPMHSAVFEVYFTLPVAIQDKFKDDEAILTEQVVSVTGLDALQRTVQAGQQKFLGVDVSYLNPTLENTYAELTITFNLNIRNATDAYVLKVFKAWEKLGYDLSDGTRTLMADYVADNLRISEANRDGTVWRSYIFHKVMITNVTNIDELNYTNNEARTLQVTFISDWWDEDLA
ncbi:MAG: hypothetical protein IJH39_08225 [Clostridia bacterium]|nr:hypothetical protein [Clostridia bacterium]